MENMLKRLGKTVRIVRAPQDLAGAEHIILPGVGAFDAGMQVLNESGLASAIKAKAEAGVPLLGVCLGMQLLGQSSEEGTQAGLGLVPAQTKKLPVLANTKVPHMGWCELEAGPAGQYLRGMQEPRFYFVHSYHVELNEPECVVAWARYPVRFVAAYRYKNMFGMQFHPEKSHRYGMALLDAFVTGKM